MSSYDFGTERIFFGQPGGQGNFGIDESGVGSSLSSMPVVPGQTYRLIAALDFDNDLLSLWVDPGLGDFSNPVVTRGYGGGNWSTAVRLGSGGNSTYWDNLVVATEWTDLGLPAPAPVPDVTLAQEPFTGYSPGYLPGQAYQGTGFQSGGTWAGDSADDTSVSSSGGLVHPTLFTSGGMLTTNGNGGWGTRTILDTSPGSALNTAGLVGSDGKIGGNDVDGTLYYSFLARSNRATNSGSSFAGAQLYRDGGEVFGVGNFWQAWAYSTYGVGENTDLNSANHEPGVLYEHVENGATHLFVVRIDYKANADDYLTVWLDPKVEIDEWSQDPALRTFIGLGNAAFDAFHFRSGNSDNSWDYDELRFGTSWRSVLPQIPEPATLSLLALGGLGLLARRKRNR
jgi:hypothetical protein